MMQKKRTFLEFTIAGVFSSLLLIGCGGGGPGGGGPPEPPPTEVVMGEPVHSEVEDTLTAVGTIEANERVQIKPEVPGMIDAILFQEGQRVKKGDKLFELDSHKENAQVAQAEAEEQLARSSLERAKTLAGTRAISRQELDQLESQLAVRSATVRLEKERLSDRFIAAPIDGILGPRLVSAGQYVNAGTTLVTLVDENQVKVSFRIPERQLAAVKQNQPARLRVGAYPDRVFEGKVEVINPEIDPVTRTAEIRLIAPNPDFLLKPGMFARVELVVGKRPQALVIAESALVPSQERFQVYIVSNGVAQLKPIQIGVRMPGKVEVVEGLKLGDPIVVIGTQKLVDGAKVVGAKAVEPAQNSNAPAGNGNPKS